MTAIDPWLVAEVVAKMIGLLAGSVAMTAAALTISSFTGSSMWRWWRRKKPSLKQQYKCFCNVCQTGFVVDWGKNFEKCDDHIGRS